MMHENADIRCLSKDLVSDIRVLMTLVYEISEIRYLASCLNKKVMSILVAHDLFLE